MSDLSQPLPINARFVQKLQRMCDDPSSDALIAWSADGTKIHILDLEPFSQQLLPQYFKHNSFSSFIRQMNTYGFNKVDADGWTLLKAYVFIWRMNDENELCLKYCGR